MAMWPETPFAGLASWAGVPLPTETTCAMNKDVLWSKVVSMTIAGRAEV